jgi:hypothetical protein
MSIIGAHSTMRDEGRLAVGQHDLLHEMGEILVELRERPYVALARIGQRPGRTALSAPVHGGDRETAPTQIGNHLEVFLDVLAASLE